MIPTNDLLNPFGIDPKLELLHAAQDAPNWSEYHYQFGYDPQKNIAVSIHIGRLLGDLAVWRGILYVFPPDGDVLHHRCIGRESQGARGPEAGPFRSTCIEPMKRWRLEFDGAMQRSTERELADGPARDNIDELVKFDFELEAAAPLYSLHKDSHSSGSHWPHHHHEQIHTMKGTFSHGGKHFDISGMGVRDHSSGPRDYTQMLGAQWVQLLFPSGKAVHATIVSREGSDTSKIYVTNRQGGYIYWNDGTPLELTELQAGPDVCTAATPLASVSRDILSDGKRRHSTLELKSTRGVQTIGIERTRGTCTTYIPPCDEIAGTDLSRLDSLQQGKNLLRATWNGEVGYGMADNLVAIKFLNPAR